MLGAKLAASAKYTVHTPFHTAGRLQYITLPALGPPLPLQVWIGVVPVGPSGHALNSSFQTRDSKAYK